jgi:hypothetical protein
MVDNVFAEIFAKICPATTNSDHHSLAIFADGTNEQLGGCGLAAMVQMIKLDIAVFSLMRM